MEAIFDTCYLLFDLVAGVIFLAKADGNMLFTLYGILTLALCGGDHLCKVLHNSSYVK